MNPYVQYDIDTYDIAFRFPEPDDPRALVAERCALRLLNLRVRANDLITAESERSARVCANITYDKSRPRDDRVRLIAIERKRFNDWCAMTEELLAESIADVEHFRDWKCDLMGTGSRP